MNINPVVAILGLAFSSLALVHAKVKISSVLVHHATHTKGLGKFAPARLATDALSIAALTTPHDEYDRIHHLHHAAKTFAGAGDEEAAFLLDLGFKPGMPREALWKLFWRTLYSLRFHFMLIKARLQANFMQGTGWRRLAALALWTLILGSAAALHCLPGLVIGMLGPLLIGGNVGSFLELASRHRWMISGPTGAHKHFALSHGRFTAPMPPGAHGSAGSWAAWYAKVAASTLARLTVVPTDLSWHIAHHMLLKAPKETGTGVPAWCDAAQAYSAYLRKGSATTFAGNITTGRALTAQSHTSILSAVDAWFLALEREAPPPSL